MARTGLLKSDVKKARDSLLAQQINPSVDAVRVALAIPALKQPFTSI